LLARTLVPREAQLLFHDCGEKGARGHWTRRRGDRAHAHHAPIPQEQGSLWSTGHCSARARRRIVPCDLRRFEVVGACPGLSSLGDRLRSESEQIGGSRASRMHARARTHAHRAPSACRPPRQTASPQKPGLDLRATT
jgi:hypothetical protein